RRQQAKVYRPGHRGAVKRNCSSCESTSAVTCAGAVSSVLDFRSQM
ncbi:jg3634, partial [Pararge aegeria aegeria]